MGETIPVPAWVVIVWLVLVAVREYVQMRRDEAMRDLWRLYVEHRM